MSPDDPRHGTVSGYRAPCRCQPCRAANTRYSKQRRLRIIEDRGLTCPGLGIRRRIEALQWMGWSLQDIADEAGWKTEQAVHRLLSRKRVKPETARRIADVFDRRCMTSGPSPAAARHARRMGFAPPLAWDDIDRDEAPVGLEGSQNVRQVDEAVVQALLDGKRLMSSRQEKVEAMRRWIAAGGSQRSLCEIHGWKQGRYIERTEDAA